MIKVKKKGEKEKPLINDTGEMINSDREKKLAHITINFRYSSFISSRSGSDSILKVKLYLSR